MDRSLVPTHGGTDAGPPVVHDFSTNAHPLGPPPAVLDAVLAADRHRYPDPSYTALRKYLGAWHGLDGDRVVPTAGGAEAIRRLSLAALLAGVQRVCVPQPGFGDYTAAAQALGLEVRAYGDVQALVQAMDRACLVWVCDPASPTGRTLSATDWAAIDQARRSSRSQVAVDQAYEPMRLEGASSLPPSLADQCWRLVCPNKALGLTGVRAAYLLAPLRPTANASAHRDGSDGSDGSHHSHHLHHSDNSDYVDDWRQRVQALAPSWVLSAEGEALLTSWAQTEVQEELAESHGLLREWVQEQQHRLAPWGFQTLAGSVTHYWMARLPELGDGLRLHAQRDADLDLDLDLDLGPARRHPTDVPPPLQPGALTAPITPPAHNASRIPIHVPPATATALLAALRIHGIKLRDATSFGYPGWVRLSVQTPQAQMALITALHRVLGPHHGSRRRDARTPQLPTLDTPENPS